MKPVVVFVDDEKNILSSLRRHMIRENYQMHFCNSGAEALEVFKKETVHIVVSDLRMPEMNGLELLDIIREKYPETMRIVLSGTSDTKMVIEAINRGEIFRYLTKPLTEEEELKITLRQAMDFYTLKNREKELVKELSFKNEELSTWQEKISNDLIVAQKLQMKLLKVPLISDKDFQTKHFHKPCYSIGGDFFDCIKLSDQNYCVYIGDVSGHGVGSAILATLLRLTARDYVREHFNDGPAAICRMLNNYVSTHFNNVSFFTTFFIAFYDSTKKSWKAFNCGHPPPLVFNSTGKPVVGKISSDGEVPLGFFDCSEPYNKSLELTWESEDDEFVFFFTDGLYEATNPEEHMVDIEGLSKITSKILSESTVIPEPSEIFDLINAQGFDTSRDDCCAILVKT